MIKNRYPLIEEVFTPLTTPELFELIKDRPYSFFLDSGMDHQRLGRYSFLGSEPFLVMNSRGSEITLIRGQEHKVQHGNPFDTIGKLLEVYKLDHCPAPVPFLGGAVGYFSYDLCHFVERLPSATIDDLKLPESYFAFYDTIVAFDHLEGKAYLVATGFPEMEEGQRLRRARMRLEEMKDWLCPSHSVVTVSRSSEQSEGEAKQSCDRDCFVATAPRNDRQNKEIMLKSNFTPEEYMKAVNRVREYIAAGDVFQVNLSQRFEADLKIPPYELYKRLRTVNPAPFASYLNFPGVAIVSASPERFLKVQNDLVETRPIKGTRPRGRDSVEDERLAHELIHSTKDRAENVMIVDLERNDLGRVCHYGTVKVTELAILETFPTVFHLTSTVMGRLRRGKSNIDLLKATFPGGSITGAPKVRAMEIIDELEPTKRSVYTGSIGYLSFNEDMDINIVIRTFLIKEGKAYFQVGGGIIYDSDPEAEYMETLDKARALILALQLAPEVVVATK
ncbi:MAG: aminodeoxychorismate synthase component I [Dehalococcoidia bacterium]|nr:aminodeoxychorismate synthase component I [Dehalococcoidia bacterium]